MRLNAFAVVYVVRNVFLNTWQRFTTLRFCIECRQDEEDGRKGIRLYYFCFLSDVANWAEVGHASGSVSVPHPKWPFLHLIVADGG